MWLLLLFFRYKIRNARLHLGKCHSHIIFPTKSVPFISFNVYQPRKGLLAKITNGVSISWAFLAVIGYGMIWLHQNVESVVVLKSYYWSWLCWSSMISSRYSSLTSAVSTLNVNGCLTHDGYDSLVGKYPPRDFASSFKCMVIPCFSSRGIEMSPIPDTFSILLTQLSSKGKFAKLSCSVRRFHKGSTL